VLIEAKKRGESPEDAVDKLTIVKREVTSAISNAHGLSVADLVLVPPGSIPITTSGKVRRAGVCRAVPATVSSSAWTLSLNPLMGDFAWSSTWLP